MSDSAEQKTYALFANPASRKIIGEIETSGGRVIIFQPIRTSKIRLIKKNFENLKKINNFDWLIFRDVLTVDYFLALLEENAIDLFELDLLRICAVGETVADRLRFSSVHSDVIPQTVEADDVLSAISDYVGENEFKKSRFLFLVEKSSNNDLTEKILAKGAFVQEFPIYKFADVPNLESAKLKVLLENGAIDEFIFTSPIDFIALKNYFKNEKLSEIFSGVRISTVDGLMLQCVKENNLTRAGLFHRA